MNGPEDEVKPLQLATLACVKFLGCTNDEIALRNQTEKLDHGKTLRTYQGRVDICNNGSYLPICDVGWDNHDAQVVCRQLYGSNFGVYNIHEYPQRLPFHVEYFINL